LFDNLH